MIYRHLYFGRLFSATCSRNLKLARRFTSFNFSSHLGWGENSESFRSIKNEKNTREVKFPLKGALWKFARSNSITEVLCASFPHFNVENIGLTFIFGNCCWRFLSLIGFSFVIIRHSVMNNVIKNDVYQGFQPSNKLFQQNLVLNMRDKHHPYIQQLFTFI